MLLAKAESTTFAAEAETFTAGAQALMARHSIDAALLAAERGSRGSRAGRTARAAHRHRHPLRRAQGLPARPPWRRPTAAAWCGRRELGFGTVMGFEADLESVELLFTSLLVQANSAMLAEG